MADTKALLLPFPEAIAYLRNKIGIPTDDWDDLAGQWQDVAFTVAKVTQLRLLHDIQNMIVRQMEKGVNVDQFRGQFNDLLDAAGWSLPNQGWRAELVIQQNVRTASAHGRWKPLTNPLTVAPYWEYRHRDSVVPRPHHLALDGQIFPSDSEIWKGIFPPPFSCKCTAHPISEAEMKARGLKVSTPPPLSEFADPGFGVGFSDLDQHRAKLINSAIDSLPAPYAALIENDVSNFAQAIEFAGKSKKKKRKSPKCTAGKSHFCRTPTGRGSCVSTKKKCRFKPNGAAKTAAEYMGEQKQYGSAGEFEQAGKPGKKTKFNKGDAFESGQLIDVDPALASKIAGKAAPSENPKEYFSDLNFSDGVYSFGADGNPIFRVKKMVGLEKGDKVEVVFDYTKKPLSKVMNTYAESNAQLRDKAIDHVLKGNGLVMEMQWLWVSGDIDVTPKAIKKRMTNKDKVRIASTAKALWLETQSKLPDGALVYNAPKGGPKGARARAYTRAGFSEVDENGRQYALVGKGGQFIPLELSKLTKKKGKKN